MIEVTFMVNVGNYTSPMDPMGSEPALLLMDCFQPDKKNVASKTLRSLLFRSRVPANTGGSGRGVLKFYCTNQYLNTFFLNRLFIYIYIDTFKRLQNYPVLSPTKHPKRDMWRDFRKFGLPGLDFGWVQDCQIIEE